MVTIVDYGIGNLFSLESSFRAIGEDCIVTGDPVKIQKATHIVLPGVGAFHDAMVKLKESKTVDVLLKKAEEGTPFLGVCLGMQLLFEKSYEYGEWEGLGLLKGNVRPMASYIPESLKIPHMGWNALHFSEPKHPLFSYLNEGDYVYFVHSFSARECEDSIVAVCEYGETITAAVAKGNLCGCQFHPEKSGNIGLKILKAFTEMEGPASC